MVRHLGILRSATAPALLAFVLVAAQLPLAPAALAQASSAFGDISLEPGTAPSAPQPRAPQPPAAAPAYRRPSPASRLAGRADAPEPPPPRSGRPAVRSARPFPYPTFRPVALPAYGAFPPPPGYVEKVRLNTALMGLGGTIFLASYGLGLIYAGGTGFEAQSGWTALPVIGPFAAAANRDYQCQPGGADPQTAIRLCQQKVLTSAGAALVLAGVGVGQVLGAGLLLAGLLDRRRYWVREDLLNARVEIGPSGGGIAFGGRF